MTHLDAVTDADREWFESHPCCRYQLRPAAITDPMPHEIMLPGSHTVAAARSGRLVLRQDSGRLQLLRDDSRW
jgi:hypothetical protein